jgi:hypothetical protein
LDVTVKGTLKGNSMPLGIFLLWPALHLMYGLSEFRSYRIDSKRRYAGRVLLALSILFVSKPYGLEKGIFFWLFTLIAIALCFVQFRIWQPRVVQAITLISCIGFIIQGINDVAL